MEQRRQDFVMEVLMGQMPKSNICEKYSISRVTGDKWLQRYRNGEALSDRSREPFRKPNKTAAEIEALIIETRLKYPVWGPRKLVRFLSNAGASGLPSPSTVGEILKRNGLVCKEASRAATPYKRFERPHPNELWQADFKGHFQMQNDRRCHPLTILDDHSRYSLCVDAKENERTPGVEASFSRVFEEYGLPDAILCDNGPPWGTSQTTGYTRFEVWLMNRDILPIHGRPNHPQTQGKEERFHRTLKAEVLAQTPIKDLVHAQKEFDQFRNCYNHLRPHNALNLDTPASRYTPASKRLKKISDQWEYPPGYHLRRIKNTGFITFNGQGYFLSEAFGGLTVAIRESSLPNCVNIYYRNFKVARIDVDERVFTSRKIYRLDEND